MGWMSRAYDGAATITSGSPNAGSVTASNAVQAATAIATMPNDQRARATGSLTPRLSKPKLRSQPRGQQASRRNVHLRRDDPAAPVVERRTGDDERARSTHHQHGVIGVGPSVGTLNANVES